MKFRKLKLLLMRKKLDKCNFYEDVKFANKIVAEKLNEFITEWMLELEENKKIQINKFKDLFSEFKAITFPIEIKEAYGFYNLEVKITDSSNHKYYLKKRSVYVEQEILTYTIGEVSVKVETSIDKRLVYKICDNQSVVLTGRSIIETDRYGNCNSRVDIYYNDWNSITEITFKSEELKTKMKVKYFSVDEKFEKIFTNYIMSNDGTNWYYYDVLPIFKWMLNKDYYNFNVFVNIVAEVNNEVVSELIVNNSIVERYTVTKIINEGEMHTIKKIFTEKLEVFLKEHN